MSSFLPKRHWSLLPAKVSKKRILTREKNLMWLNKPSLLLLQKIILTQSTKQRNHKDFKEKINQAAINPTKVNHSINQGLLK